MKNNLTFSVPLRIVFCLSFFSSFDLFCAHVVVVLFAHTEVHMVIYELTVQKKEKSLNALDSFISSKCVTLHFLYCNITLGDSRD